VSKAERGLLGFENPDGIIIHILLPTGMIMRIISLDQFLAWQPDIILRVECAAGNSIHPLFSHYTTRAVYFAD